MKKAILPSITRFPGVNAPFAESNPPGIASCCWNAVSTTMVDRPRKCASLGGHCIPALGALIEPMSCAVRGASRILAATNLLSVSRPKTLIIGGGLSGVLISYLLHHSPNFDGEIYLYDITQASLPWVDKLGLQRVEMPEPDQAHLIVECSGSPDGLATALRLVRKAGIVCIYGVPKQEISLPVSPHELFMREITVITSFAGATDQTMGAAIAYIKRDEEFFEQLLGRMIPLEKLPDELTVWCPQPGTRTVVDMSA